MPRKTKRITAAASGAGHQASSARRVERTINDLSKSARDIADDAELIYQEHAPRRSGRLARGIRAVPIGDQVIVTAVAVDPKSQYDYVAVTRFGHRKDVITPVNRRGKLRKSRTVKRSAKGQFVKRSAGFLAFKSRGRFWFLPSVRGFKPKGDWTERAWPEIQTVAATEMDKTGNRIMVDWSS